MHDTAYALTPPGISGPLTDGSPRAKSSEFKIGFVASSQARGATRPRRNNTQSPQRAGLFGSRLFMLGKRLRDGAVERASQHVMPLVVRMHAVAVIHPQRRVFAIEVGILRIGVVEAVTVK